VKIALITLSDKGAQLARRLASELPDTTVYLHKSAAPMAGAETFEKIVELTREIFTAYDGLVYLAPCGVVVRALDGNLAHKTKDPAVVVVDVGGRHAVSLLGGHEAGANALAVSVANALGAEPVISTTTEAVKTLIVGVGCRRGVNADEITTAVKQALAQVGASADDVRVLASADIKSREEGLLRAARLLGIPVRFITSDEIRNSARQFTHSELVEQKVNLPAVAEPAALLAGSRTKLVLPKTIYGRVTVAVAKESCMWSE